MEIFNMPQWYIVYTRPLMEKRLASRFAQKNIVHYCPMKTVTTTLSKRQKSAPVPLFTSYVFVYITPDKHSYIKKMWEVINLVHWLNKPVIIDHKEMDMLRKFLALCNEVTLEKIPVSKKTMSTVRSNYVLMEKLNIPEADDEIVTVQWHCLGVELRARMSQQVVTTLDMDMARDDIYQQSSLTKFAI